MRIISDIMDEITVMSYEHIVGGLVAGVITYACSVEGVLPITNEVLGVLISILLVYFLGRYAESRYGREKISLSSWIMNGILPFYFLWMVVLILLLNYVVI